jgi:phage tail-like protein
VAQDRAEQRASFPLAAYNFRVSVEGASMRFVKVSGLQRQHQTATYRHGLSFLEGEAITKFRVERWETVTLEQGTVIGSPGLARWLEERSPATMELSLCDADGQPAVRWRIAKALPVRLSAPAFDARSNEASIDTLELKAAGISVVPA